MKKLMLLSVVMLMSLVLVACSSDQELSGKYEVSVGDKGNVEYIFDFKKDGKLDVIYSQTNIEEQGEYTFLEDEQLSKDYDYEGMKLLHIQHIDGISHEYYIYDPNEDKLQEAVKVDELYLTDIDSMKEEGNLIDGYGKNGILYLEKK